MLIESMMNLRDCLEMRKWLVPGVLRGPFLPVA